MELGFELMSETPLEPVSLTHSNALAVFAFFKLIAILRYLASVCLHFLICRMGK